MKLDEVVQRLLSVKQCERCGAPLKLRTLSMLDAKIICPECKKTEMSEPEYKIEARRWMSSLDKIYSDIPRRKKKKK